MEAIYVFKPGSHSFGVSIYIQEQDTKYEEDSEVFNTGSQMDVQYKTMKPSIYSLSISDIP